jgi:hypothetical protein
MEKKAKIMAEIYTQVVAQSTKTRTRAIDAHNRKTHVQAPNFEVGDYVLVADPLKQGRAKLQVKWKRPRRIVRVDSELIYVVENCSGMDLFATLGILWMAHALIAWRFPVTSPFVCFSCVVLVLVVVST